MQNSLQWKHLKVAAEVCRLLFCVKLMETEFVTQSGRAFVLRILSLNLGGRLWSQSRVLKINIDAQTILKTPFVLEWLIKEFISRRVTFLTNE